MLKQERPMKDQKPQRGIDQILDKLLIKACVHCDEPVEAEKGLREHKKMVAQAKREMLKLIKNKIDEVSDYDLSAAGREIMLTKLTDLFSGEGKP